VRMVGDDRDYSVDPDDVTELAPEDYCAECGQVGCRHDGREGGPLMRESDIIFESGSIWVGTAHGAFVVYRAGITHSTPDSSYALTDDGKSIAIARAQYLAKRESAAKGGR